MKSEFRPPPTYNGKVSQTAMAKAALETGQLGPSASVEQVKTRVKDIYGYTINDRAVKSARTRMGLRMKRGRPSKVKTPDPAVWKAFEEQDEETGIKPRRREAARVKKHSPAELAMDLRQMISDWGWDEVRKMLDVLNPEG